MSVEAQPPNACNAMSGVPFCTCQLAQVCRRSSPRQIHLRPLQTGDVGSPRTCSESKRRHVRHVLRQLGKKPAGLLARQEPYTTRWFLQHAHLRHPVEPFPFVDALAQNGPHDYLRPNFAITVVMSDDSALAIHLSLGASVFL